MVLKRITSLITHPHLLFKYLQREKNLTSFLGLEKCKVKEYLKEANQITRMMLKHARYDELGAMFSPLRGSILYVCIRALKPIVMVETGVASGSSTRYILTAMKMNSRGMLYSIDLPNVDPGAVIPKGKQVGWLVPEELKSRWRLIFGQSQEKLPLLLESLKSIDAFLHDSEHSYQTMIFEYETAWHYLRDEGLLLSDDVHWNKAFHDFVRGNKPKRWTIFNGLGAMIK